MIGRGSDFSGCQQQELAGILNLAVSKCGQKTLVPDYISTMPVAPDDQWNSGKTGFYIIKTAEGEITISSCNN